MSSSIALIPRFDVRRRRCREDLFDHQLWCLGCDIRRPDGNLLVRYGFERHAHAQGSAYSLACDAGARRLVLWGFGVTLCGPEGALFVRRHPLALEHDRWPGTPLGGRALPPPMPPAGAWDGADVAPSLAAMIEVFVAYERWVDATFGATWRRACWQLRGRRVRRRLSLSADALAASWRAWGAALGGGEGVVGGHERSTVPEMATGVAATWHSA